MRCPHCNSYKVILYGKRKDKVQRYKCNVCRKQFCERTGTLFYRHRFPAVIIQVVVFFSLFLPYLLASLFAAVLLRVSVSLRTVGTWTRKFLDRMIVPSVREKYPENSFLTCFADEKFVKVKGVWHYWWSVIDSLGNLLSTVVTESRDLCSAKLANRKAKAELDKSNAKLDMFVTDKLPAQLKASKVFGRKCKHVTTGIKGKLVQHKKLKNQVLWVNNNRAESINSEIEYFMKRFRDSFANVESANRWAKAFTICKHIKKSFAKQKLLGITSNTGTPRITFVEQLIP